ncbi:MAG: tRNA preQ1(34) S-adenosylmethionine ribosyltransferase-isomerase QueA [Vicinamibacterales bacterium]
MQVSDFHFELPPGLIAQEPSAVRGASRLLRLDRRTGRTAHHSVVELPGLLRSDDLLVINNTRVFPARLLGQRDPSGGGVECLLVRRLPHDPSDAADAERWEALVHPGQKLKPGARMLFQAPEGALEGEVLARLFHGRRVVRLRSLDSRPVQALVDAIGHMPLPPYIKRDDRQSDRDRYQTVYATRRGSIAAPTAGLHFTPAILEALEQRGIETTEITLHVGYGTFQPVRTDVVEEHRLESERYEISEQSAAQINQALASGRRVVAVGTTTTRTLEGVAAASQGRVVPGAGDTNLFIYPGFAFQVVSGLLTNFHLPESSLLMLVCAFAGRERVLQAYREAVAAEYRFYSYGDAMLIA